MKTIKSILKQIDPKSLLRVLKMKFSIYYLGASIAQQFAFKQLKSFLKILLLAMRGFFSALQGLLMLPLKMILELMHIIGSLWKAGLNELFDDGIKEKSSDRISSSLVHPNSPYQFFVRASLISLGMIPLIIFLSPLLMGLFVMRMLALLLNFLFIVLSAIFPSLDLKEISEDSFSQRRKVHKEKFLISDLRFKIWNFVQSLMQGCKEKPEKQNYISDLLDHEIKFSNAIRSLLIRYRYEMRRNFRHVKIKMHAQQKPAFLTYQTIEHNNVKHARKLRSEYRGEIMKEFILIYKFINEQKEKLDSSGLINHSPYSVLKFHDRKGRYGIKPSSNDYVYRRYKKLLKAKHPSSKKPQTIQHHSGSQRSKGRKETLIINCFIFSCGGSQIFSPLRTQAHTKAHKGFLAKVFQTIIQAWSHCCATILNIFYHHNFNFKSVIRNLFLAAKTQSHEDTQSNNNFFFMICMASCLRVFVAILSFISFCSSFNLYSSFKNNELLSSNPCSGRARRAQQLPQYITSICRILFCRFFFNFYSLTNLVGYFKTIKCSLKKNLSNEVKSSNTSMFDKMLNIVFLN